MGIASTTTLPIQQKAGSNQFGNHLNIARGHHPYGVAGSAVCQPPKHQPHYGMPGPVVSQPPKHQPPVGSGGVHPNPPPKHPPHHGAPEPVVCQPPKHQPHYGMPGPVVSQPPKHQPPVGSGGVHPNPPPKHPPHHGTPGPVVSQPPKHQPPVSGGGVHPNPPPKHPTYPSNEDIYKNSNKFHVGFNKHEYKGKHDKYDVAEFSGPRSQYKFDYAGEGKVSVTDLQNGKKTRLDNIEAVTFGKSVQDTKPGDKSYGYDKEQFYRLAIDGKGIGEGRFKDIRPDSNMLNSTKPNADGSTNVKTGSGNDLLRGTGGDDKLSGGKGNDIFWGGTGDDKINGGKGFDTAAYQNNRDNYTIWKDEHGRIRVKDKTRNTGEDVLSSIENLRFGNGNFDVKHLKFDAPPSKHHNNDESGLRNGDYGVLGKGLRHPGGEQGSEPNMIEEYIDWV